MKNGRKKYTLKEKIKYHTLCANSGKNPATGEHLSTTQRVRHANCATKRVNQLNRFMKTGASFSSMKKNYSNARKNNSGF